MVFQDERVKEHSMKERLYAAGGTHITQARRAGRWSQSALAQAVGISQGYYGHIEIGIRRPKPEVLWRIADLLEIPREELAPLYRYADPGKGEVIMHVPTNKASAVRRLLTLPADALSKLEQMARIAFLEENVPQDQAPSERARERHQNSADTKA